MANLKITLTKSVAGHLKKQIATAESLGLRKTNDSTIQPDNEASRGKIAKIAHLVTVSEC